MAWTKAKNIILLILAAVNLLLCVLAVPIWRRQQTETQQLGLELQALFAAQGIDLDPSILPKAQGLRGLELSHGVDAAAKAVTAILGDSVLVQNDSGRFLSVYTGPGGSCAFSHSGSFSARLTLPVTGDSILEHASQVLEAMGFTAASLTQTQPDQVTALQSLQGLPIYGPGLTLVYREGALESIDGVFYAWDDSPVAVSEDESISAADALVAFLRDRNALGWVGSQVTAVEQGWRETETPSASMVRLSPVWRITTDTAIVYVDALTGSVLAA